MQVTLPFLQKINKSEQSRAAEIDIGSIKPSSFQPRREFSDQEISSLAKSISNCGLLQPLVVRPVSSEKCSAKFELVCGERRLRAAGLAGLHRVPCVVVELSDRESAIAALTENLQRRDLNCFEQAEAFERIIADFDLTQSSLALMLGISQPAVANKLRLLSLDKSLRAELIAGGLTERHARALLCAEAADREKFLRRAIDESMTAEQLEAAIAEQKCCESEKKSYRRRAAAVGDVRLFFNTVERAVKIMQLSGVSVETQRNQNDGFIEYVIRIPQKSK